MQSRHAFHDSLRHSPVYNGRPRTLSLYDKSFFLAAFSFQSAQKNYKTDTDGLGIFSPIFS